VIVNNRFMVASLLRAIPAERMEHARNLFLRVRELWGVPLEVANDGDVTALAGTMSSGGGATLGVAMGSSEAAGYIDRQGCVTGWLNELAFSPVDLNPQAAAEEWSGDRGVGALYFSQQSVNRLLPAAGVELDAAMGLPEKLKAVQELMAGGDPRAERIYRTIGVCFGYAAAHYAEFYDFDHLLVLGRVTTGYGGELLLGEACGVLEREFPDLAGRFAVEIPDEKSRRVGQAIAAASLPVIGSQP
jgi:predicted NBD/HSP70 family sugar kinase